MKSLLFFWLLTVSSLCTVCVCDGNRNPSRVSCFGVERRALLQFKNDLVDVANRLSTWRNDNIDCCKWDGIVCDNVTGHVHELHLRGPNPELEESSTDQTLKGNINPSLQLLTRLEYLDLSCNDFEASRIPSFIGSFQNLKYLNLSKSQFIGEVPYELGNLSMLVVLDLGNGPYLSNVPVKSLNWLSGLSLLRHLDMSGYDLNGVSDWLEAINTLPFLEELHLSSCNISRIPRHLTKLNFASLTTLDLSYNIFDTLIPEWIFSLSKLVFLDLTRCLFHGPTPILGSFRNMTDLKTLHVSENDFMNSSSVLKDLLSLTNLVSLDLSTCNISTPILGDLVNMVSLVSIDLSTNLIMETLPDSFGTLCSLSYVDLRDNFFSGNVSEILNFGECKSSRPPKLEYLLFSSNRFSGRIPDTIGLLQRLITLDLSFNHLSGSVPDSLGRLSSLKELRLNVNRLSGNLPDSIGNLTSLEWLEISTNNLSGSLPESFGRLEKLEYLGLHHNSFAGVLTETHFVGLKSLSILMAEGNRFALKLTNNGEWVPSFQLSVLRIGSWKLGPRFPSWIRSQLNLRALDISNTGISDIMPPSGFWNTFSGMDFLNVSHNQIQGLLMLDLNFLGPYAVVDLSNNRFEGSLPRKFNEADIVLLDLSNNNLSGSLEAFLCPSLEKDRSLKVLDLADNNLSEQIPDCWMNWKSLSVIDFENNNLSGRVPKSIGNLPFLESFSARNNKLSGNLPSSLLNSKSLQIIELSENEITGSIPSALIVNETKLKLLSLRSNKIEGEIPDELCHLNSIQILVLAHNNFSGTLPTCLYNLTSMSESIRNMSPIVLYDEPFQDRVVGSASLVTKGREFKYTNILYLVTTVDLSGNRFSGSIPGELMSLVGLRWLNLSRNYLTGRIPDDIGKMRSLESLDLSENRLDGRIPRSISSLTSLSWLNLSYNKLTGEIPISTQILTLNESSFVGNTLCGLPLAQRCNKNSVLVSVSSSDSGLDSDSDAVLNWGFIISIVVGFTIGFWTVVAPLIASKVWRSAYFNFLYKMWFKILY